jgi:DNA-binding response OmpR family regulator
MNDITILIVEDDPNIGFIVKDHFESSDFNVFFATNAEEALKFFKESKIDLCLLDVVLPHKDGFWLAGEIRKINKDVPFIFLTAQTDKLDIIRGFTLGADDYVKKPFLMDELMLRVNAVLRRYNLKSQQKKAVSIHIIGKYKFDYLNQRLHHRETSIQLTHKEAELLKFFCENINQVLERDHLLKEIWGSDNFFNARSMDVYVSKLRKYLIDDPNVEILNIRGKGYKLILNE